MNDGDHVESLKVNAPREGISFMPYDELTDSPANNVVLTTVYFLL